MQIIPVIDLKDGLVVHAVRGDRSRYQPIHLHSQLVVESDIETVLSGFLRLHPFKTFYIADLNAITGQGEHDAMISALLERHPDIEFWIDNGSQLADVALARPDNGKIVIGTESQLALPQHSQQDFILSLDFKQQQAAGHPDWFADASFWPETIIVMTLNRVGSNCGPDFSMLTELSAAHPGKRFVAAGGIRDAGDLLELDNIGINAALLATSLHQLAISSAEIDKLQAKKYPGKPGYF